MKREEAIQILSTRDAHGVLCGYTSGVTEALDMAIEALRHDTIFEQIKWERDAALQTLEEHGIGLGQRADRPQGEWVDKGTYAECSICGADSGTQFNGVQPVPRKTSFCPNCGADMRGDTE